MSNQEGGEVIRISNFSDTMKTATLNTEVAGRRAGTTASVVTEGVATLLLEDGNGQFTVSKGAATIDENPIVTPPGLTLVQEDQVPETAKKEAVVIVPRLEVDEATEKAARLFYDNYTAATGGITFNGDKLPAADEFFEDPTKQKQANAWRVVAGNSIQLMYDAGVLVEGPPDEEEQQPTTNALGATGSSLQEIKDTEEAGQEEIEESNPGGTSDPESATTSDEPNEKVDAADEEL